MDNNAAEQSIRPFCVGKKNWVMIDTVAGAEASAMIYGIAETAKANNLKPYNYFKYLLEEIPRHMDEHGVKICFPGQIRCRWNAESNFNDMPLFGAVAYVVVPTMERLLCKRIKGNRIEQLIGCKILMNIVLYTCNC